MKISNFLKVLRQALQNQATASGGKVEISAGSDDTLLKLRENPHGWRVLLHFGGYTAANASGSVGNWQIALTVQRPVGMKLNATRDLVDDEGDKVAFYDLTWMVASWMRSITVWREPEDLARYITQNQTRGALILREMQPLILLDENGQMIGGSRQMLMTFEMEACAPPLEAEIPMIVPDA
jgi:hypothetical protein